VPRPPHARSRANPWFVALLGAAIAATLAVGGMVVGTEGAVAGDVAPAADLVDLEQVALESFEPLPEVSEEPDAAYLADLRRPSASERLFAEEFPAHAAAQQVDGEPATFSWAVIIGVNEYANAGNTFGSVPDALVLRDILLERGWREDHVLVLTDAQADHDRTVRALEWLARKTDDRSTVVFSSSGHIRHAGGRTGLWPSDGRYLWAEDFGRLMGAIEADRMWITLQGCHAAGLAAPGVEGPRRIVTYSSPVTQKSYEDPETQHSLQGYYLFAEGIRDGWGDADGDGRISVQEAHAWGAPRAEIRSAWQQTPVMVDGLGEPFHLEIEVVPGRALPRLRAR
jgi:hypothetical protein